MTPTSPRPSSFTKDHAVLHHRLAPGTGRRILGFARPYRTQLVLVLGPLARRQKIELAPRLPPEPVLLSGRRDRLLQALLVVALNGIEAQREGGALAIELSVEARIFGVGGLVEASLEKSMRDGWEKSVAYLNNEVRRRAGT